MKVRAHERSYAARPPVFYALHERLRQEVVKLRRVRVRAGSFELSAIPADGGSGGISETSPAAARFPQKKT